MSTAHSFEMTKDDLRNEGVVRLLKDSLQMEAGSTLLILHQEEFSRLASLIDGIATSFKIRVDQRSFGSREFAREYPAAFSPSRLAEATPMPQGILLLMEWSVRTTKSRLDLLRDLQGSGFRWRIASMPGVTVDELGLCVTPISELKRSCFWVFAAMARAQVAIVSTRTPQGNEDKLVIPFGEFCPNISTGGIEPGTWGNFPSGETFVVPDPYASYGWITLRGSFPRRVLRDGEWIRFEIAAGRLKYKSIEASSEALKADFTKLFFRRDGKIAFENANTIAELGIGTNPAVAYLTGNPIFDEKRIGTIHLGIGSNIQFNGPIRSRAHNDVTFLNATLDIPNTTIVREGELVLTPDEAIPPLRYGGQIQPSSDALFKLSRRTSYDFDDAEELLHMTYAPFRGGPLKVSVSAKGVIGVAKWILGISGAQDTVTLEELLRSPREFQTEVVTEVFKGLVELGLLEAVGG